MTPEAKLELLSENLDVKENLSPNWDVLASQMYLLQPTMRRQVARNVMEMRSRASETSAHL